MLKHLLFIALFLLSNSTSANQEFIVQNITVDITDESAVQAQEKAFAIAEISAFQTLLQQMVASDDLSKVPTLKHEQIKNFITSFSVQDEKRSDVRYMATLQYRFNSTAIRNFLQSHAVTFSENLVYPVLIVPFMDPSHEEELQHMWQKAWSQINLKSYNLPFIIAHSSDRPQEFSFGTTASTEHLNVLGHKHKAPHVALIRMRTEASAEGALAHIDVYPAALHKPDYTIQITPFTMGVDKLTEAIHQGLAEIEKSYLADTKEDQAVTKQSLELIVPTHTLSQWHRTLQAIQTVQGLMVMHVKSISKTTAHIMVQISDVHQTTQQLLQKGFQIEPYHTYLILRMPNDAAKSA